MFKFANSKSNLRINGQTCTNKKKELKKLKNQDFEIQLIFQISVNLYWVQKNALQDTKRQF